MGAPPPFLVSLQALWEAPLDEVAATLLQAVAGPMLDGEPYPAVHEALFDRAVLDALPETRTRGLINRGPEFDMAHQVVREALALLEVNLLVYRLTSSDSMHLTRRGHVALRSGDVRSAMTIAR